MWIYRPHEPWPGAPKASGLLDALVLAGLTLFVIGVVLLLGWLLGALL